MRAKTGSGKQVKAVAVRKAVPQTPLEASRPDLWNRLRSDVNAWYATLPLPRINPDIISMLGVLVAFLFVVAVSAELPFVAWVFLLVHLFLDGLDGAVARAFQVRKTAAQRSHGQVVDMVFDRASEGILFVIPPFFLPWFPLFLLNILLTALTLQKQRAYILPLRLVFFVVFTIHLLV